MVGKPRDGTRVFRIILRVFGAFAVLTGIGDVATGPGLLIASGAVIPTDVAADPLLNSQLRFFGATWAGCGAMIWWIGGAPLERRVPLLIMAATIFIAGIGRLAAWIDTGGGTALLAAFIGIELIGAPAIALWIERCARR
ncbi:DUF4345 domain-containing protein [Sphingomonas sp. BK235]|uniref:DUF4345 domain-containing protein n=1 Tax=Sphingomonas sp. BK235 TaxID=2512131 RepID=UPI0010462D97|nr:DUF4345 domain-containing protein [Sphingomonas sp. BK235]TCP30123.1 uncharacterized protein DUF4345 [Sphingomonas sp. BK235]